VNTVLLPEVSNRFYVEPKLDSIVSSKTYQTTKMY